MTGIGVVVSELARLLGDRASDPFTTIADVHAIKASKPIETASTCIIDDKNAFSGFNRACGRLSASVHPHMGRRMKEMVAVPSREVIVLW